jgi:hypothetical protein
MPLGGADDAAAGDDKAKVAAAAVDVFLDDRAVDTEPGPLGEGAQLPAELAAAVTEGDIAAPAAEAGLDDERRLKLGQR